MDSYVVSNGTVVKVWRNHRPAHVAGLQSAPSNTVFAGMKLNSDGSLPPHTKAPASAAAVMRECRRRILHKYSLATQINTQRIGGPKLAMMTGVIDGLRECSKALCAMSPIPEDFAEDKWWQIPSMAVASDPVVNSLPPTAPTPTSIPGASTIHVAPSIVINNTPAGAQPGPAPVVYIGQGHTAPAPPAGMPGHAPAAPALTASSAAGAPSAPAPVEFDPLQSIIDAHAAATIAVWPADQEVLAEAAIRAMRGNDGAVALVQPMADAAGLSLQDYCNDILLRRAAAHEKIVALEVARREALATVASDPVHAATVLENAINEAAKP